MQDRLDNAANSVTFTTAADGSPASMGATANDAAALETQLKALILHEDGGLAVQNLAMNALSTMLPRIEGTGQWGKARWRLTGAAPSLFALLALPCLLQLLVHVLVRSPRSCQVKVVLLSTV
jgi:hypothetical protein